MALPLVFALTFTTTLAQTPTCFWPNGNVASGYEPCPDSSVCCLTGEACLSNRLCFGARYNIAYRGACTDQNWPASECPHVCHTEVANGWANIYPCPGNPNQVMTCGTAGWVTEFCEANLSTVTWEEAHVSVAQLIQSSVTPSPAPNSNATNSNGTNSDANTDSSSNDNVALGAGLGVGLGVPLLAALIGLLVLWTRARRRRKAAYNNMEEAGQRPEDGYEFQSRPAGGRNDKKAVPPQELGGQLQELQ